MKILLFGGAGQLGYELVTRAHDLNFEIVAPVISEVDISNFEQVKFLTASTKPDLIINAAAYTAVDLAESEQTQAYQINRDGAQNVARAAADEKRRMIHISTDYVFDGTQTSPISESAPTNPLNVYGASKLAGEVAVQELLGKNALIVRTSSLHGQRGINFVGTMLKLFAEREKLSVVSDQIMSPTWAGWLAEVLLDLGRMDCGGIVHASCAGAISWYEFAQEILRLAKPKINNCRVSELIPISADQFGRPAKRPLYSVLDTSRLAALLGRPSIPWQEGLRNHLREVGFL